MSALANDSDPAMVLSTLLLLFPFTLPVENTLHVRFKETELPMRDACNFICIAPDDIFYIFRSSLEETNTFDWPDRFHLINFKRNASSLPIRASLQMG